MIRRIVCALMMIWVSAGAIAATGLEADGGSSQTCSEVKSPEESYLKELSDTIEALDKTITQCSAEIDCTGLVARKAKLEALKAQVLDIKTENQALIPQLPGADQSPGAGGGWGAKNAIKADPTGVVK